MKVLLVEDSATVAAYIASILGSEADIQLLPVASNAEDAVRFAKREHPDVVLMDMKLPDHDGLWAIEHIMRDAPCPIVVLSGHLSSKERDITFESLRAGAVDVLAKPTGITQEARGAFRQSLVNTIRLMSTAVVVRRTRQSPQSAPRAQTRSSSPQFSFDLSRLRYVLLGASTGGPELLFRILSALPAPLPYPILITQHTLEGFDESLAEWLSCTGHKVRVGRDGQQVESGQVWIAPAEKHMRVTLSGLQLTIPKKNESIASVDAMFESAAKTWGEQCAAFVLTGMGRDGSVGMRAMFERGALTVAQSPESCVVASMPDNARAKGAARLVLSPDEIQVLLSQLAQFRAAQQSGVEDGRRGK